MIRLGLTASTTATMADTAIFLIIGFAFSGVLILAWDALRGTTSVARRLAHRRRLAKAWARYRTIRNRDLALIKALHHQGSIDSATARAFNETSRQLRGDEILGALR